MKPLLLAAGYLNADVTAVVPHVPRSGERVTALSVFRSPGGMTANAACAAARFGLRTEFFGRVGDDHEGEAALSELEDFGVGTSGVVRSSAPTTTALVLLDPDGERTIISETMVFDYGPLEEAIEEHSYETNVCVHVDGYRLPEAVGLLERARRLGLRTSADLDGIEPEKLVENTAALASSLDLLVLNARLSASLDPSPALVAEKLLSLGARVVAITLGEKGALVATEGEVYSLRTPTVQVRDVTGAGDAFVGAFLAGWLDGHGAANSGRCAVAAGAISVGAVGARGHLPVRQETERLASEVSVARESIGERSEAR